MRSISTSRMRRATTAHSSRSARNFGKMRPFDTAPSSWPARPTRCRPSTSLAGAILFLEDVSEAPYSYLVEVVEQFLGRALPPIRQRWAGVYSQCVDPDQLSPKDALALIYKLRGLLDD